MTNPTASNLSWTNYKHNNGTQTPIDTVDTLTTGSTYALKVIGENKVIDGVEQYVISFYIDDATIMEDYVIDPSEVSGYLGIEVNGMEISVDYDDTTVQQRDTTGYNVYNLNDQENYQELLQQYERTSNVFSKVDNTGIAFGKTGFSLTGSAGTEILLPWKTGADENFVFTATFKIASGASSDYVALSFANGIDADTIEESTIVTENLMGFMRISGASGGLSCHMDSAAWQDQINKPRSTMPLTVGETYTLKLIITDGHIMDYYINDVAVIRDFDLDNFEGHAMGIPSNAAGYLGLNVKNVVLELDYSTYDYTQTDYGTTDYSVQSPAAVAWNADAGLTATLESEDLPSHIILNLDSELNVTVSDGSAVEQELLELCETIVIEGAVPVLRVADQETADALAALLTQNSTKDVMVLSSDLTVLNSILDATAGVRGIYDVSAQTDAFDTDGLEELMMQANANDTKIILLSAASADYASVRWLQNHMMTVWAAVDGSDTVENYTVLTNGVDGVIANTTAGIKAALRSFTGTNVLLRVPTVGGHRGSRTGADGSVLPECTIDALLQAAALGANAVELDIQPTKDGVLVIHHDSTTSRLMQETVTIGDTNYEDLKDILYKEEYSTDGEGNFVPRTIDTLEDLFIAFADVPDTVLYIELKEVGTEIEESFVTELKRLIEAYDFLDRCVVITFDTGLVNVLYEKFPEVSLGYLQSDCTQPVGAVLSKIEPINAVIAPNYAAAPNDTAYDLYMRGVTLHAWTLNGTILDQYFVTGRFQCLLTDSISKVSSWADRIALTETAINIQSGDIIDFGAAVLNKQGAEINGAEVTPVVVSGTKLVRTADGSYTMPEGSAIVVLKYEAVTDGAQTYTLYSNPIVIEASAAEASNQNGYTLSTNYFMETSAGTYTFNTDSSGDNMVDDVLYNGEVFQNACYAVKGTLSLTNAETWGQAQVIVAADESNRYVVALEKISDTAYQIFAMSKLGETLWNDWRLIEHCEVNGDRSSIDFEIVVIGGHIYFLIDDAICFENSRVAMTVSTPGFSANNVATSTVANLSATVFADSAEAEAYIASKSEKEYVSRFQARFDALEQEYLINNNCTGKGGTLLFGDSNIDFWSTWESQTGLVKYVTGYNIGIGGSTIKDWLYAYDQLVAPFEADRFVFLAGDNDINVWGDDGETAVERLATLFAKLHADFPDAEIYYIYTTPSPSAYANGVYKNPKLGALISGAKTLCDSLDYVQGIDMFDLMTTEDKLNGNEELFAADKLHMSEAGYAVFANHLYEIIFQNDPDRFFGIAGDYRTTSQWNIFEDTGANTGTVTVSEDGIAFGYVDGFCEEIFYFETKIHVNGINASESWPKFGLFAESGNVRHSFYVDMTTDLTSNAVGRVTSTDGTYDWSNIQTATVEGMAFSGDSETVTLGVLKDGVNLHFFVNGVYVLSYTSEFETAAVGVFGFNTGMTLSEYYTDITEDTINAKLALIPEA